MLVGDFLKTLKIDFQEKNTDKEFWGDPQLFVKIKRAYRKLQNDIPYFISIESLLIKKDIQQYNLKHEALQEVFLKVDGKSYEFCEYEDLNIYDEKAYYTFEREIIILAKTPIKDGTAKIHYKYAKQILNENCSIELPSNYDEALRCLTLSYIYEKSRGNSKERDLSVHYLKRYNAEKEGLNRKRNYTKNITSTYQII